MSKSRQLASIRIRGYEFKIIDKSRNAWDTEFYLYRCWHEYTPTGTKYHKTLDGKFPIYADAIRTVANYQEYFYNYCRVQTLEQISV